MHRRKYGSILIALLVISGLAGTPSDNALNKKERKVLLTDMKDSRNYFLKSIRGLSDKQLDFKSSPEKWSVRECAEHITKSEDIIYGMIENSLKQSADPSKRVGIKFTDEQLIAAIVDRTKKAQAPEVIKPTGQYKTMQELTDHFTEQRNKHISYVKTTTEDLRNHVMPHPFFGQLDCYQWLLLMSGHSKRHTDQINEVKSDPHFPKG